MRKVMTRNPSMDLLSVDQRNLRTANNFSSLQVNAVRNSDSLESDRVYTQRKPEKSKFGPDTNRSLQPKKFVSRAEKLRQ